MLKQKALSLAINEEVNDVIVNNMNINALPEYSILGRLFPSLKRKSDLAIAKRTEKVKAKRNKIPENKGKNIGFAKKIPFEIFRPIQDNESFESAKRHIKGMITLHEKSKKERMKDGTSSNRDGTHIIYIDNGIEYSTLDLMRDIGVENELLEFINFQETEDNIFQNFIAYRDDFRKKMKQDQTFGFGHCRTKKQFAEKVLEVFNEIADSTDDIHHYTQENLNDLKNRLKSINYEPKVIELDEQSNHINLTCNDDERYIHSGLIEQITNSMPLVSPYFYFSNQINLFSTDMFSDIKKHDFCAYILNKTMTGTGGTTDFFRRTLENDDYQCVITIPTTTPMNSKMLEYFEHQDKFCFVANNVVVEKDGKTLKSTTKKSEIAKALRERKSFVVTYDSLHLIIEAVKFKEVEHIHGTGKNRFIERIDFDSDVLLDYEIVYDEVHVAIEYAKTFKPETINSIYYNAYRFKTAIYMTATLPTTFAGTPLELIPIVNLHWNDKIRPVITHVDLSDKKTEQELGLNDGEKIERTQPTNQKVIKCIARKTIANYDKNSTTLIFSNSHSDNIRIIRMLIASSVVKLKDIIVRCSTNDNTKRRYYKEGVNMLSDHREDNFDYAGKVVIHTSVAFQGSDIHIGKKVKGKINVLINSDHNSIGTMLSHNTILQICGRIRTLYRNGKKISSHEYFLNQNDGSYEITVVYSSPTQKMIDKEFNKIKEMSSIIVEIDKTVKMLNENNVLNLANEIIENNDTEEFHEHIGMFLKRHEKTNGYLYNALVLPLIEGHYVNCDGDKVKLDVVPYIVCGKSLVLNTLGLLSFIENIQKYVPHQYRYVGGDMIEYIETISMLQAPNEETLYTNFFGDFDDNNGNSYMTAENEIDDFFVQEYSDKMVADVNGQEFVIDKEHIANYAYEVVNLDEFTIKTYCKARMRISEMEDERLFVARLELAEQIKRYNAIDSSVVENDLDVMNDISAYDSTRTQEYRNALHALDVVTRDKDLNKLPINEYNYAFVCDKFKQMMGLLGNIIQVGKVAIGDFKQAFKASFDGSSESVKQYFGYYKNISKATLSKFFVLGDTQGQKDNRSYGIVGIKPLFQLAYNEYAKKNGIEKISENIISDVIEFVGNYSRAEYQDDGSVMTKAIFV